MTVQFGSAVSSSLEIRASSVPSPPNAVIANPNPHFSLIFNITQWRPRCLASGKARAGGGDHVGRETPKLVSPVETALGHGSVLTACGRLRTKAAQFKAPFRRELFANVVSFYSLGLETMPHHASTLPCRRGCP